MLQPKFDHHLLGASPRVTSAVTSGLVVDGTAWRQTVGSYQLEAELGSGSTGVVWRARRIGPVSQEVALKRLRPGVGEREVERLREEATVLTQLDHPHIVRVIEVIDDDGLAVVMQYAPGGSLADLLAQGTPLPPGQVVALAAPIADALASAHRRQLLHCDVKPANILFTSDGEPLLSDFGVARHFAQAITADQSVAGTAEYLAPELLDGGRPDVRSDVYSLGVVCYEALAGRPPFTGTSPLAVVRAADSGRHPPLAGMREVPRPLAQVVERAMARRPADRHAGAADLARDLRAALGTDTPILPVPVGPGGPGHAGARGTTTFGPRPPRPVVAVPRHRPRVWVLGGLLGALTLAALTAGPLRAVLVGGAGPSETGTRSCPALSPPTLAPGAALFQGDLDGDGCDTFVVRQGDVVEAVVDEAEAGPRRFQVGRPDDVLLLGDWDCDRIDTPGLYRPTTGEVFYFFEWARSGAPLPNAVPVETNRRDATPEVSDDGKGGCQEIVLRGGAVVPPDLPGPPERRTNEA